MSFRLSTGVPTDPTTPDTEFSSDGGATFADCAEEITTGGVNGMGYLTLTGAETNNNVVLIAAKSANCLTTPAIVFPRVLPILSNGTLSAGSAGGGTLGTILGYDISGCIIRTTGGTGGGGTGGANNQARVIVTYTIATGAFTVEPNWETTPDATTTYDVLLTELAVNAAKGNVESIHSVSASSVTTINANVGTTQPTNYTGTAASALVKSDAIDWNSVAVTGMPMPTYTQPTGFLAATFPSGTIANTTNITAGTITTVTTLTNLPAITTDWITAAGVSAAAVTKIQTGLATPTNITAGTITTVTNLTNAPTAGDFTTAMKTSLNAATPAVTVSDKTGFSLSSSGLALVTAWTVNITGSLSGSVGSVTGAVGSVTAGVTVTTNNDKTGYTLTVTPPTAATIATTIFTDLLAGSDFSTAASFGKLVKDNLDAAITSRMATYTQPTGFLAATFPTDPAGLAGLASAHGAGSWATATGFAVAGDAMALTSAERNSVADALLDRTSAIETGLTPRGCFRLIGAACAGKLSGATTGTEIMRNAVQDSKARITATVDSSGNRTAITWDVT